MGVKSSSKRSSDPLVCANSSMMVACNQLQNYTGKSNRQGKVYLKDARIWCWERSSRSSDSKRSAKRCTTARLDPSASLSANKSCRGNPFSADWTGEIKFTEIV